MANTIKLKRSAVPAKVPTTGDLQLGELALNTYDGKLYTVKDNGSPSIVEIGGAAAGVSSFSAGTTGLTPSTATSGAVTLAGTLAVANGGTGVTSSTGSGSNVLSTSPTLVTPILGTPTSGTLTNCTGYTFANLASKPTTLSGYGITDAAPLASPTFTGTPAAPTAAVGTNTTQLATTAYVNAEIANDAPTKTGSGASGTWGISVTGNAATVTNGVYTTGNQAVAGIKTFSEGIIQGNTQGYPDYEALIEFGADVANTWRKIIGATLVNGQYSTIGFKVEVTDPKSNHANAGSQDTVITETYYVACVRSNDVTLDNPDACYVRGPSNRIRAVKTATGVYEVQIQNEAQWREYRVRITAYAVNGTHAIVYYAGDAAASAGTAQYNASISTTSKEVFQNIQVVGTATGVTPAVDTNTTQLATTAFVVGQAGAAAPLINGTATAGTSLRYARQDHIHPTDTTRAPLASPTFTGVPAAPTAAVDTNTTQLATTAYVVGQGYLKSATASSTYAPLASPTFTGVPAAPTAALGTNTTQLATCAYVNAEIANDAPTKTGGGASGSWGISVTGSSASCTGNAATATTATTATSATNFGGATAITFAESLRANDNISGGGTLTVDASSYVKWGTRYIVITNGRGSNFSTGGYFDISCPLSGTITGVGGAADRTATSAGIPLTGAWEAIYYILPVGSGPGSLAANFRVALYTADLDIPHNWILLCLRNGDDGLFYFPRGNSLALNATLPNASSSSGIIRGVNGSGSVTLNATQNVYEIGQYKSGFWEAVNSAWTPTANDYYWGATFAHVSNGPTYNYCGQLAFKISGGGDNLYARTISNGTPTGWSKLLSTGNFNSYVSTTTGTGAWALPSGTTAQRPGSPVNGMARYNSTLGCMETYVQGVWQVVANTSLDYGLITSAADTTFDYGALV